MKEKLLKTLELAEDNARYFIYRYTKKGTFSSGHMTKAQVFDLLNSVEEVTLKDGSKVMAGNIGISLEDFSKNIVYPTQDTEEFIEYTDKHNPYYKIFIKLDKNNKTITFKLGNKEKTLELLEHTDFVSKPYKSKYLQCVTVDSLEQHIQNDFWKPRMVIVGREVLKIKGLGLEELLGKPGIITGFSCETRTGEWKVDWKTDKSSTFKPLYKDGLGYFIKLGKKNYYLTSAEVEEFETQRTTLLAVNS